MAGARIEVTFDDGEAAGALNLLASRAGDMTPAMRDIGEHLLNNTRERFAEERAPDGTPWAPLSETTKKRKRRHADKILTESGALRGHGLVYRAGRSEVEVGSPLVYAGTHQFGAARGAFGSTSRDDPIPWGDIPARPFLGLSGGDRAEIQEIIANRLREHIR